MSNLEKFILIDNETQKEKDCSLNLEYEIYGLSNSWGGVIFERNINNHKQVLFHVSNGLKVIEYYLDREDYFFRKGDDNFFLHYRHCDDYKYSKDVIILTDDEIVKVIKEYIYLRHPNLMSKTLAGWDSRKGVLHDPNHCHSKVMLDNGKAYSISKSYDEVKIKVQKNNDENWKNDNLELVAVFKLDENMYEKALDFNKAKRTIYKSFYGKLSNEKLDKYMRLKKELEDFINNN